MFSRLRNSYGESLRREDIEELHYIISIANLASIMEHGILSHRRVARLGIAHDDVSASGVQDRRAFVIVPRADVTKGSLRLHRHANLYLNAHNAMMYVDVEKYGHENLCVLRIRREILDRGDAMLSTRNSSTNGVRFFTPTARDPLYSPRSTHYLTVDRVLGFGEDKEVGKPIRQAEVLLPYQIDPSYIGGVFVSCENSRVLVKATLESLELDLPITVHPSLFFQGKTRFVSLEHFTPLSALITDVERSKLHTALPESSPEPSDAEEEYTDLSPPSKRFRSEEKQSDVTPGPAPK